MLGINTVSCNVSKCSLLWYSEAFYKLMQSVTHCNLSHIVKSKMWANKINGYASAPNRNEVASRLVLCARNCISLACKKLHYITVLIIYMTKLLQSDWLRGVQLFH